MLFTIKMDEEGNFDVLIDGDELTSGNIDTELAIRVVSFIVNITPPESETAGEFNIVPATLKPSSIA